MRRCQRPPITTLQVKPTGAGVVDLAGIDEVIRSTVHTDAELLDVAHGAAFDADGAATADVDAITERIFENHSGKGYIPRAIDAQQGTFEGRDCDAGAFNWRRRPEIEPAVSRVNV